jgi:hypothetical protein
LKFTCTYLVLFTILFSFGKSFSQNENSKWYFGNYAGLNFMTNPPSVLNNSNLDSQEACSSISDASGNLLFYTDGVTVYNPSNVVMANGSGLFGHQSMTQGALIIKQPGNASLYYIFTVPSSSGNSGSGLCCSIVDMSLASGMGSVTVKNATVYSGPVTEKLNATKHCNGTDYWVMIHDNNYTTSPYTPTSDFRAFLFTSAGINTTAVVSSIGTSVNTAFM